MLDKKTLKVFILFMNLFQFERDFLDENFETINFFTGNIFLILLFII